jgi:hypothetical protein
VFEGVKEGIPLLLSKPSMKSLKMNLDLENDLVVIDNEVIKLTCTTSGHYRLPLTPFDVDACNITLHAIDFDKLDVKQKKVKS